MTRFELGGVRVWGQDGDLVAEVLRADWRLVFVTVVLAERLRERGVGLLVTSVERTVSETQAIYKRQGKTPPAAISVHDVRPTRGLDGVPIAVDELGLGELPSFIDLGQEVADEVNARCIYGRGLSCCIWHEVAGIHFHNQVPSGGLELAPDAARPFAVARGEEVSHT